MYVASIGDEVVRDEDATKLWKQSADLALEAARTASENDLVTVADDWYRLYDELQGRALAPFPVTGLVYGPFDTIWGVREE